MTKRTLWNLLLAEGANVNAADDGATPLHLAAVNDRKNVVELLLANKADVNAKDYEGQTPLHWADAHKNITSLPLAKGADVNAKDNLGHTPLHWAAKDDHKDVAEILLANKADVNVKDDKGETPLQLAASNGKSGCHGFAAPARRPTSNSISSGRSFLPARQGRFPQPIRSSERQFAHFNWSRLTPAATNRRLIIFLPPSATGKFPPAGRSCRFVSAIPRGCPRQSSARRG